MNVTIADLPEMPVEQTVRGKVVNDLGVPIEGALIAPEGAKTDERRWWGRVEGVKPTVTDAKGTFAMLLPKNYRGVDLEITADGHAGASAALLPPGKEEHRVIVPTGTRVKGRLVNNDKPVAGLRVAVVQMNRDAGQHFIQAVHSTTDDVGQFVFDYLPPTQAYAIFTPVPGNDSGVVLTTKRFTAGDSHKERDLGALEVTKALRLAGRVELPAGQVLPPNSKLALGREPAWDLVSIDIASDGRFEIDGLPVETYEVRVSAEGLGIDAPKLNYQQLGPQEFGIRLEKSIDDLVVPLRPTRSVK